MRDGHGIHYYLSGDKYDGEWYQDKRHGRGDLLVILGKIIFKDGGLFDGEFENDETNGEGTFTDKWSNVYGVTDKTEGSFRKGELFGNGKAILKNGDEYRGEFKSGKFNGKGVMIYKMLSGYNQTDKESGTYKGEWKNGIRSGIGEMRWTDSSLFEGEWRDDARVFGKLRTPTGVTYEGYWKRGLFHNKGTVTLRNGIILSCIFNEAIMSSKVTLLYIDNSEYYGKIKYYCY